MDRGPVALFGAIVAVGLGPAMWLGAQFGHFEVAPARQPVPVDRTHADTTQLMGGSGGGGANEPGDDNNSSPVRTKPRAHIEPMTTSRSASPSSSPTDIPSTPASDDSSAPSDDPSPSPSDSTDPAGTGDDSTPPSPPADDGSSSPSSDTGYDGSGTSDDDGSSANVAADGQARSGA
jgi:hypothetical protein